MNPQLNNCRPDTKLEPFSFEKEDESGKERRLNNILQQMQTQKKLIDDMVGGVQKTQVSLMTCKQETDSVRWL